MVQSDQLAKINFSVHNVCIIDNDFNFNHSDLPDKNNGVWGQGNTSQIGTWHSQ